MMNHLQKTGGFAALLLGFMFIGYMGLLIVVLPGQGLGPGTLNDPAKGIPFVAHSLLPVLIDSIYLGIAITFALITLALYARFQPVASARMQIAAAAGLSASVLFLGYAMINFVGSPVAVKLYEHDVVTGGALYITVRTVANGLNAGALFAAGWTILLAGWASKTSKTAPSLLAYLMMVAGGAMIVSFVLLPVGLLGIILAPVWSIWLGGMFLRGAAPLPVSRHSLAVGSL